MTHRVALDRLFDWNNLVGSKNPNQVHRHQKPTCWHSNQRKFHVMRGIICCACSTSVISVLQCALKRRKNLQRDSGGVTAKSRPMMSLICQVKSTKDGYNETRYMRSMQDQSGEQKIDPRLHDDVSILYGFSQNISRGVVVWLRIWHKIEIWFLQDQNSMSRTTNLMQYSVWSADENDNDFVKPRKWAEKHFLQS